MGILEGFRDKDFLDQITILNELASNKDAAELGALIELFDNPVGDTSIDYMVVNALNAVLSQDEAATVAGLSSDKIGMRTLCIRVAGEYAVESAVAPLMAMAEAEPDPDRLMEVLTALSRIGGEASLPLFRSCLFHEDALVAALAVEVVGRRCDVESLAALQAIVDANEADDSYERCEITTWKAIEALAEMGGDAALGYLVSKLHHRNPTARRIITDALVRIGEPAVPQLLKLFSEGDKDQQVLAANVVGFIASKSGASGLVAAHDRGETGDPNVRYAVYEALGRIGGMKALICLMDGLSEDDDLILMAVIGGLERHVNPGLLKTLSQKLAAGDEQAERLGRATIASGAVRLFRELYGMADASGALMDALVRTNDPETLAAFREVLDALAAEAATADRAKADIARLPELTLGTRKALAVDDSRSMTALMKSILADLGYEAFVASNGAEAYALVDQGERFELIVTDMNMPVMDGMEFTEKLRATEGFEDVPVIMVTTESEASQRTLAGKTGVTAFVTKPFKPVQLKETIASLMD